MDNLVNEKIYQVLLIDIVNDRFFRIIDENNKPNLYPSINFDIIDNSIDTIWIFNILEDKYYNHKEHYGSNISYIGPKVFNDINFFDNFFKNKNKEVEIFNNFLKEYPYYLPK